ncbi:uncharacterized protein DNG_08644 [Cephalotrichum gorgonifer]|uniref:Uncharacterized protein n=1 Tax=Cephalotrichum gorgonifer TaxID=2041049 RepID=A0AAE8SYJ8_9PEZI|nr:uncharacterized protein DNG_08644 [Cephalotrichum gorgonifer]
MSDAKQKKDVTTSLGSLSLGQASTKTSKPKSKAPAVADSWEDEDTSSGSDAEASEGPQRKAAQSIPSAPPSTPISPSYNNKIDQAWPPSGGPASNFMAMSSDTAERRRPEKTDAVARRMIASALGVKAPKLTDEQKAYDKAIREQVRKKREEERDAERARQAEAEKAKAAIWED